MRLVASLTFYEWMGQTKHIKAVRFHRNTCNVYTDFIPGISK